MNKPSWFNYKWLLRLAPWLILVAMTVRADSLWVTQSARSMTGDKRAAAVGDILNIVVEENATTTKGASTKTSKSSGLDASVSTFLYSPAASGLLTKSGQMPAIKYGSKHDFDGNGKIDNSEHIVARIAVQVIDVLPNRNLIVEGRRQTAFSGETQDAVLRGIVRPEDIGPNNTVFSYNVADASIRFISKGSISNAQKKGWFTRIWDKLTPF